VVLYGARSERHPLLLDCVSFFLSVRESGPVNGDCSLPRGVAWRHGTMVGPADRCKTNNWGDTVLTCHCHAIRVARSNQLGGLASCKEWFLQKVSIREGVSVGILERHIQ